MDKQKDTAKNRLALLQEAAALEQLGGEWSVEHVAAFCLVSVSSIYRSDCPRIEKSGPRAIHGRSIIRFDPKAVRVWNASRTKHSADKVA